MSKKIDIAGIQLDNCSVRDAIAIVEEMLGSKEFNTVGEVNMETLKSAEINEMLKTTLEGMDYTVISDVGILRAVGPVSLQKKHEIENRDFFYEMLERIEQRKNKVYLITSEEARLKVIGDFIADEFPEINVVGVCVLEDPVNFSDEIVNEINSMEIDVVMTVFPSPAQEQFLEKYKGMLLASLWYGASFENFTSKKKSVVRRIRHMIDVHRLAAHIKR